MSHFDIERFQIWNKNVYKPTPKIAFKIFQKLPLDLFISENQILELVIFFWFLLT